MQKLTYSFFLFVIAPLLLLFSCSRDDIDKHGPIDPDSMLVTFELVGSSPATYGLSHEDELSVSEVKLLLFNINNELIDPIPVKGSLSDVSPGKIKVEAKVQRGGYGNIMLLANSKSILEAATLTENMTYEQVREKLLMNFTGKWVAENGAAGIPMYGETGFVNVKNVDGNNFSASLTRMLCRVDLAVDVKVQATFNLTSVRVYNREVAGVLAAPKIAGDPLMPTTPSKIKEPLIYQGDEITPTGKAIAGEIYLMESLVKGSPDINRLDGAVCLVVGGFYTHNGIVSAKELFYRVDFSKSHSDTELHPRHYYDLVRSHHYKINIISVSGPGEEDPDVALEKEISFIDVVVTDWGTGGTIDGAVDGQYTLRLSQGEFNLFSQAYIDGSTDNKLTVSSNHPDGWWIEKITDESDMEIPSDGWLSTTLPLKAPQMSDKTFSLLLEPNTDPSSRIGYIYIQSGPRMQYKLKVTQKNKLFIDKIEWEDYDGMTGVIINDDKSNDTGLTSITVTQSNGSILTSDIRVGVVDPSMGIESAITEISVTYKGYVLDVPVDKYTHTESSKTLAITDRSLIGKAIHLDKIRTQVEGSAMTGNYIQVSDVDLTDYTHWEPIGTSTIPFKGSYTGGYLANEYKIINLTVNEVLADDGGLFGYIAGATLTKIYIGSGSSVKGKIVVGSICGWNEKGTISGCTNIATVEGENSLGGICGHNNGGTISASKNFGAISGANAIGGICGHNNGGTILKCANAATVTGTYAGGICGQNQGKNSHIIECHNEVGGKIDGNKHVAGICGWNEEGTISGSTNAETVEGTGDYVAGICGWNNKGAILNSTNAATVTGIGSIGGICGYGIGKDATITNCENLLGGNISGVSKVGGICGNNGNSSVTPFIPGGPILGCKNYATVKGTGKGVGGIVGYNVGKTATITDCDNLSKGIDAISGVSEVSGICGRNGILEGTILSSGGPILRCTNAATVTGTGTDTQVGGICGYNIGIDATITDCKNLLGGNISGVDYVGGICGASGKYVMPDTYPGGAISGCTNNATVKGTGKRIGGICGSRMFSTITKCDNLSGGHVSGLSGIGGICGHNTYTSTISECTNAATVTEIGDSGSGVGGICGHNSNSSPISGCINYGVIKGAGIIIAGICGYNSSSSISGCTNNGTIEGAGALVGGISGHSLSSPILGCTNNATVKGKIQVGGICGQSSQGNIHACINTALASINATHQQVGGICGNNLTGNVSACYNLASVTAGNGIDIGAVVGTGTAPENCYFGENADFISDPAKGSTKFTDSDAWPDTGMPYWSEYSATNPTGYWLSIGSWPLGGTPTYPKLRTTP